MTTTSEVQAVPLARSVNAPAAPPLPTTYTATVATDGEVVVDDVPIFAENQRGSQSYDRKWLQAALRLDQSLRASGYKAPMHFGHHDVAVTRERAGSYELTRVSRYTYRSKPRWVLFARLTFKDQATLDKALKDYPYRSVEIAAHDAPGEVNSLALLSTEAPYFRFPNLENLTYAVGDVVGFAWRTKLMADQIAPTPAAPVAEKPAAEPGDGSLDTKFAKMVIHQLAYLSDILKQHFAKDEVHEEEEVAEEAAEGDAPPAPKEESPIVAAQAAPNAQFAALEGKVAGLAADNEKLRRDLAGRDLFAALMKDLAPYGIANVEKELSDRIAKSHEAASAWAAGIKAVAPKTRRPDEDPQDTAQPQDAAEVTHYAQFGPEKLAEAKRLASIYHAAPPRSLVRNKPLSAFLAAQPTLEI